MIPGLLNPGDPVGGIAQGIDRELVALLATFLPHRNQTALLATPRWRLTAWREIGSSPASAVGVVEPTRASRSIIQRRVGSARASKTPARSSRTASAAISVPQGRFQVGQASVPAPAVVPEGRGPAGLVEGGKAGFDQTKAGPIGDGFELEVDQGQGSLGIHRQFLILETARHPAEGEVARRLDRFDDGPEGALVEVEAGCAAGLSKSISMPTEQNQRFICSGSVGRSADPFDRLGVDNFALNGVLIIVAMSASKSATNPLRVSLLSSREQNAQPPCCASRAREDDWTLRYDRGIHYLS